jgi:formate hydrogenlyase subunit 3/multisubunit Na+/H+ antiporter MnhD subunit
MTPVVATTQGGALLVLAILLPAAGILASFALGRLAERIALGSAPIALIIALAILAEVWRTGRPIVYDIAGLSPPLGIALRADGASAVMLITTALIIPAAGLYARAGFASPPGAGESRKAFTFWILLQAISAALAIVFVSGDLFNLYVALELLTFAAVPLACVEGRAETFAAALRYLLFALFGSIFYLLGAALLYGAFGTLDIALLAERMRPLPAVTAAAALMTAGLLAKTALFPLHLWLPPAHANAPAPASAVLSGLVVKGSFFLTVRLWFYVLPALPTIGFDAILGALGSAAVVFGSVLALMQQRLKLLIAYSTIAQIGYLFLIFPLGSGLHVWTSDGWNGGLMQVLAHAFAKTAMFLAAGLLYESLGHDKIARFSGAARAMPMTFLTLGLAGLSLMGLPPSGGFAAKWLLLRASVASGQWLWALVLLLGGLLAAGYVYRILAPALSSDPIALETPPRRAGEVIALTLALVAVALGFAPESFFQLLDIGRPGLMTAGPP